MEWLKELLGDDDLVSKITKELPKHFIPKEQYNKKIEELNTVITDRDTYKLEHENSTKTISDLKSKAELADKYKTDYESMSTTVETLKSESAKQVERVKKEYILERKLIANKAVEDGIDLLKKEFDIDSLVLDGDDIKDFDSVITPIKEKRKSFFYNVSIDGQPPKPGDPPAKAIKDMSIEEYAKQSGVKGII